ncbi:M1 family aminopeptidase [Chitinophagaceae bacterium 26-R-25]|nr:M1 family aminopeptidase [Chitinophagaceae bacterium 26-R-25]
MKRKLFLFTACGLLMLAQANAQSEATTQPLMYQATATKVNDLVHTKLEVSFDYDKSYMYGKAWVTLQPHFYETDTLALDAKGMDIKKVAIVKGGATTPLKYEYDGWMLNIKLDKKYKGGEKYTVYIDYTAKPNELKVKGSAAITDAKGLYFINPKGEEKDKPTQIWTQGETEANSVWCPTIDKPNQKTTDEISMTVPAKYVTLSNGLLISQKKNADGTRTDYWKMDLPHAPYLMFMGVGDYAVVKDKYGNKEVSYYVEKEYEPVARRIFGYTPEMMAFYKRITGIDYAWQKYSQIVGRDYVSGAMENTTATLHQESAQQDARELVDGNGWESTIAHELFHHWFGDLVTAESWSNLTVNESFANYSETLWDEYKHGKDAGDAQNYTDMRGYLQSNSEKKDLVRFYYADKEDMFDAVSYNKGGRILHMLRNYVGDSAFFKSLNNYLTTNKFKAAEAQNLRLAFEEVTGKDLNWYFNQWYYGAGHPKLNISYAYDDAAKQVTVTVKQTQDGDKTFRLPFAIDVYNGSAKIRYNVEMTDREQKFTFPYGKSKPELVNVDGDKILLCEKTDDKSLANFIHQYKFAGNYLDRREAIDACVKNADNADAQALLKLAVNDRYFGLRNYALSKLKMDNTAIKEGFESTIANIAKTDKNSTVRAQAISLLAAYNKPEYKTLFEKSVTDSSYSVAGEALEALGKIDPAAALAKAQQLKAQPAKGKLMESISGVLIESGSEADFDYVAGNFDKMPLSQAKMEMLQPLADYIAKVNNTTLVKKGVDMIVEFRESIPAAYKSQLSPYINNMVLMGIAGKKKAQLAGANATAAQEQIDYIKSKAK